ncbi:MAG: TetR/AcrR family transcriptional regulator [Winogradskyella sp.]|uniref:TetR/AcrR family transcriptional regulator n=1 Tax=Winogradskyella sp. TaxID=1883156 RepID=UPI000F413957|nr:TetR/AcrR family transcriptional regulator [Winogradskyella sp.]RNC86275.1 MAG: TetR/AcrR family transcriptional regulator [Winogradskyella sp.]
MPRVEIFNREDVLEKAVKLFHNKGYNATSMQDLVDATGLNRSSIYNSFGSKMELYQQSLRAYKAQANKYVQKVLVHNSDPLETIRKIFATSPDDKVNGCLLGNCTTEMANQDIDIKNFLTNNLISMQDLFVELVASGQASGSINGNKSAKDYAAYLFTALQGIRVTGILLDEQKDFESIVDTMLSVLE